MLFGAAWAAIPAYLQAKRGSHIVITTIMFNFIAAALLNYMLVNVMRPAGSQDPATARFAEAVHLPTLHEMLAPIGITFSKAAPANISLIIAVITTISNVLFDSLVGYTLCKFRFPGRYIIFIAILSTLMIPTEMLVIPWYLMSQSFGWLDTHWGIMFPGLMTAFGTFLMKQFFETVPDDFIEAARIDGLNELQIWWTVAMPLVKPALAALAIFVFLGNWTAFIWPLIVTNSWDMYTLPVGLSTFADEADVAWELVMTGAAISTIPTLVVFLIFQRFIIRGVVMAGLKG